MPITAAGRSGSSVRPYRMLNAFKQLGYSVIEVVGDYSNRKRVIQKQVLDNNILFLYGESANMPLLLTNKYRMPTYFGFDQRMFKYLQCNNIPVGLFYRDIYWAFDSYKKTLKFRRRLYKPFWMYELRLFRKYCSILFMPTLEMPKYLPITWDKHTILPLPPGCEINKIHKNVSPENRKLRLLYVGNIAPPLYNLYELFSAIKEQIDIELDIICRKEDWLRYKHLYHGLLSKNIFISHKSGIDLKQHYQSADVFITYRGHHPYLDITLPIKIHEAWSFGLPVILKSGGLDAKWVKNLNGGWIVSNKDDLQKLFNYLKSNKSEIEKKRKDVQKLVPSHSWLNRARYVADILTNKAVPDETFL